MHGLRRSGLTKYESSIYEALIRCGKSTAQELSVSSRVPKTAVYPNIKKLITYNLVQEIKGDPSIFEALPLSAFSNFVDNKIKVFSELKDETLNSLKKIKDQSKNIVDREVLSLSRGKEASSSFYYSGFAKARRTYFILGWRFENIGDKYNLLKHFAKIVKAGVDVRLLITSPKDKVNLTLLADYREAGVAVKHIGLDNFSLVIIDGRECKITLKNQSLNDKYNIAIVDQNLSKAMNSYFLDCWSRAENI
jgi:sugar-specific transcriptional regulator TrmB